MSKKRSVAAKKAAVVRTKSWAQKNPERIKEYRRAYRAKNKKRIQRWQARWLKENPDYMREYNEKYRKEHKASRRAAQRKWVAKNRDKVREYHRKYYLKRKKLKAKA